MRTRNVGLVLLLVVALVLAGCVAGPYHASEGLRDWASNVYADNTYVGTLNYLVVVPIAGYFCALGDLIFINNYHFWSNDVWAGEGTTHDHRDAANGRSNPEKSLGEGWTGE